MGGLGALLKDGANYFAGDDHEYWNNYPNKATLIQNSWTASGRMQWGGPARHLFRQFQRSDLERAAEPQTFNVPPASFMILDSRVSRGEGNATFLLEMQIASLHECIGELNARRWVGFLCLGQLMFETAAGWALGAIVDRNLPDYAQYPDLVRALATSRQPLVVLTGGVHDGRVARGRQTHGPELDEVVSSSTSLIVDAQRGVTQSASGFRRCALM